MAIFRPVSIRAHLSKIVLSAIARHGRFLPDGLNPTNYPIVKTQLRLFLDRQPKHSPVIIFPPSLDWNTQLFQRPQQLALALAKQGAIVLYFQPPPYGFKASFDIIEDRLILCHFPVELLFDLDEPYVYLLTWNRSFAKSFRSPRILYDFVDDLSVFAANAVRLRLAHHQLLKEATLVITSARQLYEQVISVRSDAILCPNGVDYELISSIINQITQPPQDLLPILKLGKPVIGYYGALARWFDYSLYREIVVSRPDLSFVLIGPDYDSTLPPDILKLPNVCWLGPKPYREIPAYLNYFDVAIIPFIVNEVTNAVSPLKLFEYMAARKPVVITPIRESSQYSPVLLAATAAEFASQINKALELRNNSGYLSELTRIALENTWQARAKQILSALSAKELP